MSTKKFIIIKKKISSLMKAREDYIEKLLQPKPMIIGSYYEVYKTCSKPNCCCKKNKKHGPFPALSTSIKGKKSLKMVRKIDADKIKEKAYAYRTFQQGLAKVRKINNQIDDLIEKIKSEYSEEYK